MIENLTGADIAAEIKMLRTKYTGAIAIVEGDSDELIYRRFFNMTLCNILSAYGKQNAIEANKILEDEGFKGIIVIVDADFDWLNGNTPNSSNIFLTDSHDIEIMMINSLAFDRVLIEYGSDKKIERFLANNKESNVRSVLLKNTMPIGIIKWVSANESLRLNFEGINSKSYITASDLKITIDKFIDSVLRNSREPAATKEVLLERLDSFSVSFPMDQICNGHDICELFAISLRKAIGSCDSKVACPENIECLLRLAYDSVEFSKTDLCRSLCKWEKLNQSYQLLIEDLTVS